MLEQVNAEIARLTYLTNGRIGRDWRDGKPFVLFSKGDEWCALLSALDVLRSVRTELEK